MTQTYLLIDDDEVFSSVLSRALHRRGAATMVANNALDAIALLRDSANNISHAVLDLNMGRDSGLALLPQLKAINSELLVVVLTGYSSIATTVEAMKRGAVNYLCKPASADDILRAFDDQAPPFDSAENLNISRPPSIDRIEWEHIQRVLTENNGNISATARALGMHRRTLQRKLQKRPTKS